MRLLAGVMVSAILLIGIKSASASVVNDEMDFRVCKGNETVALKISTSKGVDVNQSESCQCKIESLADTSIMTRDGYFSAPGIGVYKLHRYAKKWNEARKICMEEGGHLAIINSKAEEAVLMKKLNKDIERIRGALDDLQAYIGVHDMFKEGDWVTIFGESIEAAGYSEWSPSFYGSQPDNYMGSQNCGTITFSGGMDDVFCTDKFAFFCEIPSTC